MSFIERFKSLIEQQLEGWGPDELVSVSAELGIAACVVVPLFAAGLFGRWAMRKYDAPQGFSATSTEARSRGAGRNTVGHRW
jgi:hypothetical protein